jgi:hypothetical protein
LTVVPRSLTRASSNSYSVLQRAQRTSILMLFARSFASGSGVNRPEGERGRSPLTGTDKGRAQRCPKAGVRASPHPWGLGRAPGGTSGARHRLTAPASCAPRGSAASPRRRGGPPRGTAAAAAGARAVLPGDRRGDPPGGAPPNRSGHLVAGGPRGARDPLRAPRRPMTCVSEEAGSRATATASARPPNRPRSRRARSHRARAVGS